MPILSLGIDARKAKDGARDFKSAAKTVQRDAGKTEKTLGRLGAAMAAIWLSGKLKRGVMSMIDAVDQQQKSIAQLNAGLKSTGGISGQTLGSIRKLAAEMQQLTIYSNETVESSAAILLSFTSIADDVFPRVVRSAADVATRMGQDLNSTMVQLGKALNDPVANLGALSRSGIQFSKNQKQVIKSLWETGRQADAQRIILEELERQYGGSARAARDTLGGAITGLKNNFDDLKKTIGENTTGLREFVDYLDDATVGVNSWTKSLRSGGYNDFIEGQQQTIEFMKKRLAAGAGQVGAMPTYLPRGEEALELSNASRAGGDVIRELIGQQRQELALSKMSEKQRRITITLLNAENKAYKELETALHELNVSEEQKDALFQAGVDDIENNLKDLRSQLLKVKDTNEDMRSSFVDWTSAASNGLTDIVTGAQDAQQAVTQFANSITRMAVQASFQSIFSPTAASAHGNVFSGGSVVPFASGGIVTRPTVFPMANGGTGLMGEAGPEAVMPLGRDANGDLGVKGGGGMSVSVNVYAMSPNPNEIAAAVSSPTVLDTIFGAGQMRGLI